MSKCRIYDKYKRTIDIKRDVKKLTIIAFLPESIFSKSEAFLLIYFEYISTDQSVAKELNVESIYSFYVFTR